MTAQNNQILTRIAEIHRMPVDQLKVQWQELFDAPPPNNNRSYLVRELMYHVQAEAFGDPYPEDIVKIEALADKKALVRKIATGVLLNGKDLSVGTMLTREFDGTEHVVTVTAQGFEYGGTPYKSLSAIAKKITGTQWSGNAFFGLTNRKKKSS